MKSMNGVQPCQFDSLKHWGFRFMWVAVLEQPPWDAALYTDVWSDMLMNSLFVIRLRLTVNTLSPFLIGWTQVWSTQSPFTVMWNFLSSVLRVGSRQTVSRRSADGQQASTLLVKQASIVKQKWTTYVPFVLNYSAGVLFLFVLSL